jgi:hypothetical protein
VKKCLELHFLANCFSTGKCINWVYGPMDHGNRAGPWSTMDSRPSSDASSPEHTLTTDYGCESLP